MQKTLRTGAYERRTKAHETDDLDPSGLVPWPCQGEGSREPHRTI
jgi:hypothetical protein